MSGFIKLHRKTMKWEWWEDHNTTRLWFYILMKANYEEKKWQGQIIPRGSFITGLYKLSEGVGLTPQKIRTSLEKLKKSGNITIKSTNKNTLVTVVNYDFYQGTSEEITNEPTNEQQTDNKQITTTKNINNTKKLKKEDSFPDIQKAFDLYNEMASDTGVKKAKVLSEKRKKHIKARLKDAGGIDGWKSALDIISQSAFLRGEIKDWVIDIDFMIRKDKFISIMEGKYNDNERNSTTQGPSPSQRGQNSTSSWDNEVNERWEMLNGKSYDEV